jgi:hypothetical protein
MEARMDVSHILHYDIIDWIGNGYRNPVTELGLCGTDIHQLLFVCKKHPSLFCLKHSSETRIFIGTVILPVKSRMMELSSLSSA